MKVNTEKPIEVKNELKINVDGHHMIKYLQYNKWSKKTYPERAHRALIKLSLQNCHEKEQACVCPETENFVSAGDKHTRREVKRNKKEKEKKKMLQNIGIKKLV